MPDARYKWKSWKNKRKKNKGLKPKFGKRRRMKRGKDMSRHP